MSTKNIVWVAKKEFRYLTFLPTGYVFAFILIGLASWMFVDDLLLIRVADLRPYWGVLGFMLSLFVPAVAMNLVAEEKRQGTWELMLSWPLSAKDIVLGKFVGALAYVWGTLLLSLVLVASVWWLSGADIGVLLGGLLGTGLLAASYLALGLLVSVLSPSPVVAFLITLVILLLNNLLATETLLMRFGLGLVRLASALSLSARAETMQSGLISLPDGLFFISWSLVILWLAIQKLKR